MGAGEDGEFRWETARTAWAEEVSLATVRAFVERVAGDLDPDSRYVTELLAVIDASRDVADYLARLEDAARLETFRRDGSRVSEGERGASWVDGTTWRSMDPLERTLANLLTGETRMMWAGDGAQDFALLGDVLSGLASPRRVLSLPCSTGKEVYSIAIAGLRAGVVLSVLGVDRQEAYVVRARSGVLVPHHRDRDLEWVGTYLEQDPSGMDRVAPEVLACCSFQVGDVLTGRLPEERFGFVSCRNLLGYFRDESLETAWRNVSARVRSGGVLLLDPFVTGSKEMGAVPRWLEEAGFRRRWPKASYYDAP